MGKGMSDRALARFTTNSLGLLQSNSQAAGSRFDPSVLVIIANRVPYICSPLPLTADFRILMRFCPVFLTDAKKAQTVDRLVA